jgi:hypothetical protein
MPDPDDTPIQRMLAELAPGERRLHARTIPPSGADSRFWRIGMDGRIQDGSLRWVNDYPEASARSLYAQYRSVHDIEQPILEIYRTLGPIGDLYHLGAPGAYVWGEALASVLLALDPEGVEMRTAIVRGGSDKSFYLGLFLRQLEAIDLDRTTVALIKYEPGPNGVAFGTASYPDGLYVRSDLPRSVHCFCDPYTGRLFFSHELVDACERAGVTGIVARDPAESRTVIEKTLWLGTN